MNLPIDFQERMKKMLGSEYAEFEKSYTSSEPPVGIRIVKKEAEKNILDALGKAEKIPWCETGYYADKTKLSGNHPYHICGLLYFQEPSATAPVSALPIDEGDYVLDLCAAPGGKATQAAEKLSSKGLLLANEIIPKRAEILAENIERCGISNAIVTNETPERLAGRFPKFFDKIIVDAPCSGEGMFRKEPRAISEWSIAHTLSCAERQKNILSCAVTMLRPGGYLVYSTCTFSIEENEEVIEYILSKYPELSLEPISLPGLSGGFAINNNPELSKTKRIFPHRAKGEGHFLALLKKDGEAISRTVEFPQLDPPKIFSDFDISTFKTPHIGNFVQFGDHLYLLHKEINLDKIRVIRAGLYMGMLKKGRFEPSHALALATAPENFKHTINLSADSPELLKYLKGEVIKCEHSGWTCVLADGFPIGWGKGVNGELKNHFPKKFRLH